MKQWREEDLCNKRGQTIGYLYGNIEIEPLSPYTKISYRSIVSLM
jgi:hypothetical protein